MSVSAGSLPTFLYAWTTPGGTISTIANYFGATSNISLVANAYYYVEIICFFLNTTSGTVTWTLNNSAAPTSQNVYFQMSPVTGLVAPPGTATDLEGAYSKDATAARSFTFPQGFRISNFATTRPGKPLANRPRSTMGVRSTVAMRS